MPKKKIESLINESHPGLDPWVLGYEDAKLGFESKNNPYDSKDQQHTKWLDGWNAYKRDSLSKHFHTDSDDFQHFDDDL